MFAREKRLVTEKINAVLSSLGLSPRDRIEFREIPFSGAWGISTTLAMQLAGEEGRAGKLAAPVSERARQISETIARHLQGSELFTRVEAVKGFVNMYFDMNRFGNGLLDEVLTRGDDYGRGEPKTERVMVEYSQPNTHKAFHVGHLRNACLGSALANIMDFAGFDTVTANYIGDIGLHVIKCLWAYRKFHAGEEPRENRGVWLGQVYAEAEELTEGPEAKPEYQAEVRELFQRWERRDPELSALWEKTRQWSLEEFYAIYDQLGIHFDQWFFESEVEEPGKKIVEELVAKGIAEDGRPDEAVVVKIDEKLGLKDKYRTLVILRSDGTSLYSTKDLALAKRKFEEFGIDRSIYVIDVRQTLYLQQVFKVLEMWGFQARKCYHLSYEIVTLPTGVMKSRQGNVILFEDFYAEMLQRARALVETKNPDLTPPQKDEVSRLVALGAIKYSMLDTDNNRVIVFDWNKALSFEGQAAPYIQYAHTRACGILEKAAEVRAGDLDFSQLTEAEINLIKEIGRFPDEVQRAAEQYKPLYIATYLYDLASAFTDFYHACPVLKAETDALRRMRLALVKATAQTLKNGLRLLGIQAPEYM